MRRFFVALLAFLVVVASAHAQFKRGDALGRAYACYMLISESSAGSNFGASMVMARSSDNGASWQNLGVVVNIATAANGDSERSL
jgi:hypothetical protein